MPGMELTEVLGIVAATFGVGMGASPLLQARRAHLRRSADDVSLGFIGVLFCGAIAWMSYGIADDNLTLVIPNAVGVCGSGTALLVALRYRHAPAPV